MGSFSRLVATDQPFLRQFFQQGCRICDRRFARASVVLDDIRALDRNLHFATNCFFNTKNFAIALASALAFNMNISKLKIGHECHLAHASVVLDDGCACAKTAGKGFLCCQALTKSSFPHFRSTRAHLCTCLTHTRKLLSFIHDKAIYKFI